MTCFSNNSAQANDQSFTFIEESPEKSLLSLGENSFSLKTVYVKFLPEAPSTPPFIFRLQTSVRHVLFLALTACSRAGKTHSLALSLWSWPSKWGLVLSGSQRWGIYLHINHPELQPILYKQRSCHPWGFQRSYSHVLPASSRRSGRRCQTRGYLLQTSPYRKWVWSQWGTEGGKEISHSFPRWKAVHLWFIV